MVRNHCTEAIFKLHRHHCHLHSQKSIKYRLPLSHPPLPFTLTFYSCRNGIASPIQSITIHQTPNAIQNGVCSECEQRIKKTHTYSCTLTCAFRIVTYEQRRVCRLHLYIQFFFRVALAVTCDWFSSFCTFTTTWQQQQQRQRRRRRRRKKRTILFQWD